MEDGQVQDVETTVEATGAETAVEQPAGVTQEDVAALEAGEEAAKSTSVDFGDLDAASEAYRASQDESAKVDDPAKTSTSSAESGVAATSANTEASAAAEALAAEYRKLPGVVADLIGGATVEEVTASLQRSRTVFETVKSQALQEAGNAVPPARSGPSGGGAPPPATPFDAIAAGLDAYDRRAR